MIKQDVFTLRNLTDSGNKLKGAFQIKIKMEIGININYFSFNCNK